MNKISLILFNTCYGMSSFTIHCRYPYRRDGPRLFGLGTSPSSRRTYCSASPNYAPFIFTLIRFTPRFTQKVNPQCHYKEKAVRLSPNCLIFSDPPGAVKPQRCMVSISKLSARWSGDSLIYHADSSMFCTELQIL